MHKLFQANQGYLRSTLQLLPPISNIYTTTTRTLITDSKLSFLVNEIEQLQSSKPINESSLLDSKTTHISDFEAPSQANELTVRISHPCQEWVELIECLLKRGYFAGHTSLFQNAELGAKDSNHIRTACLNFARERFDLIKYLSRKDMHIIAGCGCPNLDRKVVNSGKRLRAHVGIEEGNVCSSCTLRGNCERAYMKARENEGGRTVDVMRILLTYGLDHLTHKVESKQYQNKLVKESVGRLLKEIVNYSTNELDSDLPKVQNLEQDNRAKRHIDVPMKQGDWLCPKCDFLNFARNFKCLRCDGLLPERARQLREDQEHLPLKKGDWICDKCNFLNFAKNSRCLQCKENPPKRHLNPGEWECDSCNYINFRRNMLCMKCDHARVKAKASDPSLRPAKKYDTDLSYLRTNDQTHNKGTRSWIFVEDESIDHSHSKTHDKASAFVDFPVVGGKSELSRDTQRRESWKLEMLDRSKSIAKTTETDLDLRSDSDPRMFLELADDEEMSDWFGHGKKITERLVTVPGNFHAVD